MKTASYISTQTSLGGSGKYPLSTQTLDFIQSQILLLQQLALTGGGRYVLKEPDGTSAGVVVIDGEVLTLSANPVLSDNIKYVTIKTETADIEADGETYLEARTTRTASYSTKSGGECFDINDFTNFATNTTLHAKILQMPSVVLNYLSDILAEKLSVMSRSSITQSQLDGLKEPCIVSCRDSIKVVADNSNYSVMVTLVGDIVRQQMTLTDGRRFVRMFDGESGEWSDWGQEDDTMHIEVKISQGTVYLRHGYLPASASIVLLRKKRRSNYRRTGGGDSKDEYKGVRVKRLSKTQYVHFKGIVLSQGVAGKWYVPHCIAVADMAADGGLIDKELPSLCKSLVYRTSNGKNDEECYRIQGMRNKITSSSDSDYPRNGYAQIAIQAARVEDNSKGTGGEMVRLKYRVLCTAVERVAVPTGSVAGKVDDGNADESSSDAVEFGLSRSFSLE